MEGVLALGGRVIGRGGGLEGWWITLTSASFTPQSRRHNNVAVAPKNAAQSPWEALLPVSEMLTMQNQANFCCYLVCPPSSLPPPKKRGRAKQKERAFQLWRMMSRGISNHGFEKILALPLNNWHKNAALQIGGGKKKKRLSRQPHEKAAGQTTSASVLGHHELNHNILFWKNPLGGSLALALGPFSCLSHFEWWLFWRA